ncbi:MAG TPA: DUF5329 domain-containing protein [Candidatus Acidoferrales bacterium]|nr:DUF5329 domain-containing protein [Candidatus Acidoferrales bacterium]
MADLARAATDVLVIGDGIAGCAAALAAQTRSARVIAIEKARAGIPHGNSAFCGGALRGFRRNRRQKRRRSRALGAKPEQWCMDRRGSAVTKRNSKRARMYVGALFCATILSAAAHGPDAQAEIEHLLRYLEISRCQFYRNGSWHGAPDARAHLEKKYRYLLDKGLIRSAEDFIQRAAAESSTSGKPYLVKCGAGAPVASARWLSEELSRYRKNLHAPSPPGN